VGKLDQVVRSRWDGRLEVWFLGRGDRIIDRMLVTRSRWWPRLVIMLEVMVRRGQASLVLLPGGWEVWVPADRVRVTYTGR